MVHPDIACYWVWKQTEIPFEKHVWDQRPNTDYLYFALFNEEDIWDGRCGPDIELHINHPNSELSISRWEITPTSHQNGVKIVTWSELVRIAKRGDLGPPTYGSYPSWFATTRSLERQSITRFSRIGKEIG